MLSRFSKLPGLSNLLSTSGHSYPQEEIDASIKEVKSIGKREGEAHSDECVSGIERILSVMGKYSESLHIQRVSCHALSNLAMHVSAARVIIRKGGFKLIARCMERFPADHKLHWLGASALWNCARPPVNRGLIGKDGVKLMFKVLGHHPHREKVVNTAIGALSNLSLQDDLKNMIAQPRYLSKIVRVLRTHLDLKSLSVMTSGAGLLANLAVSDLHAAALVKENALAIVMDLLTWNLDHHQDGDSTTVDETLHRNSCAALNNMVTAEGFLESFLMNRGIECVYRFLGVYKDNELYMNLLENVLLNIDADRQVPTTSFHMAAFHGQMEIVKGIVERDGSDLDLDEVDGREMTALDYAMSRKEHDIVTFLCKVGASKHKLIEDGDRETERHMREGRDILKKVQIENKDALMDALPHVPTDLCGLLMKFQSNTDLLKGMDLF